MGDMSVTRRYWISIVLASVLLTAGLALVGLTLSGANSAGRTGAAQTASPCRSCAIFARIESRVNASLDTEGAAAFITGLRPWLTACGAERQQCLAMFAPAEASGLCADATRSWTALETRYASALRDVSRLSVSCRAMSCPVLSCSGSTSTFETLQTGGDALRLFILSGTTTQKSNPQTFATAIGLIHNGRTVLTHLMETLAPDVLDFAGEWAFWQNLGGDLDTAGDALFMRGDLTPAGRDVFAAGANAARLLSMTLEKLGSEDGQDDRWKDLGNAFGAFVVASARIDELIAHAITGTTARTCGADIVDRARRLDAAVTQLTSDFSACGVAARCPPANARTSPAASVLARAAPVTGALEEAVDDLVEQAGALSVADSPSPGFALEFSSYAPREPMRFEVDAGGNRCVADGGTIALAPVGDAGNEKVVRQTFAAGAHARATIAAPDAPGFYVAALLAGGGQPAGVARAPLKETPFEVKAPPSGCDGFAGTWSTDFGEMTAVLRGNELRGTYRQTGAARPGLVTGTIKGREMRGTWISDLGVGGARLVLSADGTRFSGTWGESENEVDGAGLWRGRCVDPATPSP